jgi:acetyl-CoA C-acetyltransferase
MVSPPVTGAVAVVLASEEFVAERASGHAAWIRGMGWATETGFLGDRDLATAPALQAAASHAYAEAGITSPGDAFNVAEIAAPTPYQELLALEGLGLSSRDKWRQDIDTGRFDRSGALPVNPSGGARKANAVFCNGLISIAEAANQVRGKAVPHQIAGAKTALAHAASGFAMQYQTVVVFGQDR